MSRIGELLLQLRVRRAEVGTILSRRFGRRVSSEEQLRGRIVRRVRCLGRQYEDGNSNLVGFTYHPIYFPGFESVLAHRAACDDRLRVIADDLAVRPGDWVLDIGANVGYFSFGLAARGALVEAYEAESDTFEIGAALAQLHDANVNYINRSMSRAALPLLRPRYRAILLLSVFHWIVKQEGEEGAVEVLRALAERAERLYFEVPCNAGDAQYRHPWFSTRESVESFLGTVLPHHDATVLQQDAGWMDRVLYRITPRGHP